MGSIPSPAYLVNVSGSTMVITVSRCIIDRVSGSRTATMRSTSPPANSCRASRSTPAAVVRSLIPTSTAPPPSTRMSPPSVVATPFSEPADHTGKPASANSGCQR